MFQMFTAREEKRKGWIEEKTNRETGVTRLRPVNRELLGPIIDWIEFSAPLLVGPEFKAFWESILDRMKSARYETDWNEPEMAEYLLKFILAVTGDQF